MVGATGFEPATICTPNAVTERAGPSETSQRLGITRDVGSRESGASPDFAAFRGELAASLLLALEDADCLLTVGDMARMLRLTKASVYKLVSEGRLAHVRIGNAIRFVPGQLSAARPTPPGTRRPR